MDAQSVKNTDAAERKGYDGGKKVSGIKKHLAVDTSGLPFMIRATTANVTDRRGALEGFASNAERFKPVGAVLCDGGYTGGKFAGAIHETINAEVQTAKGMSRTNFRLYRNVGWSNVRSHGWKNAGGGGKIVKGS